VPAAGARGRDPGVCPAGAARGRHPVLLPGSREDRPGTARQHAVGSRHHPSLPRPEAAIGVVLRPGDRVDEVLVSPVFLTGAKAEARELATTDRSLSVVASNLAVTESEFDDIATAFETGSADDIEGLRKDQLEAITPYLADRVTLAGLELGVAGLVYCLAAAGMNPAASCRGHPGPSAWSRIPVVLFAADRIHAELLVPLVRDSGAVSTSRNLVVSCWRSKASQLKARSTSRTLSFENCQLSMRHHYLTSTHLGTIGAATTGSPGRASTQRSPSIVATASLRSSRAGITRPETSSPFFGIGKPSADATSGSLS
jgi:hypothetical protein